MLVQTDLSGVPVIVLGPAGTTGAAERRCRRAGAVVTTVHVPASVTLETARTARLAVVVGPAATAPQWSAARALLSATCLVSSEPAPPSARGRVVLVGAGPGGPGLLTVDAVRALADADVVLTDRLAQVGDLAALAPGAEVVDVGKRPGHHALPQEGIEALLVERAARGLTVVRLKGGDPFVFGRGGEEVAAAVAAGLPVTVVPGITSAVAVPGAAGIPVTHRGVSHVVTVVSGHVPIDGARATALAALGGTVVVLMGMNNLVQIAAALERGGLAGETPAAVVERGFAPDQRSTVSTLSDLARAVDRAGARSPAVIVVGDVVAQSSVWTARVGATAESGTGPELALPPHLADVWGGVA